MYTTHVLGTVARIWADLGAISTAFRAGAGWAQPCRVRTSKCGPLAPLAPSFVATPMPFTPIEATTRSDLGSMLAHPRGSLTELAPSLVYPSYLPGGGDDLDNARAMRSSPVWQLTCLREGVLVIFIFPQGHHALISIRQPCVLCRHGLSAESTKRGRKHGPDVRT